MAEPVVATDITALKSYAGEYSNEIFATLVEGLTAIDELTVIPDVKKAITFTKLSVGDGAEPFSSDFNPTGGDLDYTSPELAVYNGKRELYIKPSDYNGSYLMKSLKPGFDPMEMPFEAFTWDQVIRKLAKELNSKTIYNGFLKSDAVAFDAGDTYAVGDYVTFTVSSKSHYFKCVTITLAGETPLTHPAKWQRVNAEAICPGFAYHIAAAITAAKTTPIVTGALTDTNAVAKFELMAEGMPNDFQDEGYEIWCSYTSWNLYQKDYRERYGKYTKVNEDGFYYIDGKEGKAKIRRASWMGTSGRLISSLANNLVIGTDALADFNEIRTIEQMYGLEASITFALGTQVIDWDALKLNDQS